MQILVVKNQSKYHLPKTIQPTKMPKKNWFLKNQFEFFLKWHKHAASNIFQFNYQGIIYHTNINKILTDLKTNLYSWRGTGGNLILKVLKFIGVHSYLSHTICKFFNCNSYITIKIITSKFIHINIVVKKGKKNKEIKVQEKHITSKGRIGSKNSSSGWCNESKNTSILSFISTTRTNQCWPCSIGKKSCKKTKTETTHTVKIMNYNKTK